MNHIEEKIIQTIDEHREEIIALAKDIQSHPQESDGALPSCPNPQPTASSFPL